MAQNSAIEWTDATWNPVTGCNEISPGCDHCYAKTFAERFRGVPGHPYEQGFDLKLWPDRLTLPMRWKKPRRIFVNSMSDLFHKDVPDSFIDEVLLTMVVLARHHTYQVLTKRPKRMARYFEELPKRADGHNTPTILCLGKDDHGSYSWEGWRYPHIWLGTSIESDAYTWRADYLRRVPAAVRFISAEPLLSALPSLKLDGIHWLISGGESGHGARPCHPDWARDLRDRCAASGVAYFHKQNGEWVSIMRDGCWGLSDDVPGRENRWLAPDGTFCNSFGPLGMERVARVGKARAGRLLDGVEHNAYPE